MKLQLKYKDQAKAATQAAFISGNSPKEWLAVLQSFNIQLSELECYIIPFSKGDITANGLFIIFSSVNFTQNLELLFPYQKINDNLFIPVQSKLYPLINDEEWKDILFYDRNFFHPTLGLIGFNLFDAVNWNHLIYFPELSDTQWSIAEKGNAPFPTLNKINILLPPQENIIQTLGEGIEKKPLSDLPKDKNDENSDETFFEKLARKSLKKGLEGTNNFRNNFGSASGGNGMFENMLSGIEGWMQNNLNDLEKKRNDEINRLLDLFENDPEEALKYALPLNGKYKGRGQAPPSGSLGRRNTNFSLGGLDGGGRSDSWDIGDNYHTLMAKYRRTAEQLIEQKKYKKAAYIYANLLGDYSAAANVLKQGKHYHEAAALYKIHLKNNIAAAQCYEEGGLYFEAIEMYKEIGGKDEKLGDLYSQINQDKNAHDYYRKAIDIKKKNFDFLYAGNLLENKLGENKEAKELYLEGWKKEVQKEACLLRYFDMSENNLSDETTDIYRNHTAKKQQLDFLNILIQIKDKNDKEFQKTSKNIAYEIISQQSQSGHHKSLHKLNHFIKNDSLISSDISRFIIHKKERKKIESSENFKQVRAYELSENQDIKWIYGKKISSIFIAFGVCDDGLYAARWDLKNYSDLRGIDDVKGGAFIGTYPEQLYVGESDYGNHKRVVFFTGIPEYGHQVFSANSFFNRELKIESPAWLPNEMLGFFVQHSNIIALVSVNGLVVFKTYDRLGKLLQTHDCKLENNNEPLIRASLMDEYSSNLSKLIYKESHYYMARGQFLTRLTIQGSTTRIALNGGIAKKLFVSSTFSIFRLIVVTERGCLMYRPTKDTFNPCGSFFAVDDEIKSICFIKNHIAIAYLNKIELYLFDDDDTMPELISQQNISKNIVSIHIGYARKECLILTESGSLVGYKLPI